MDNFKTFYLEATRDNPLLRPMITPPGGSKGFSLYPGKITNRKKEFESLIKTFKQLSKSRGRENINIASFPYQYGFEREYINQLQKPVTIWVFERASKKFKLKEGASFIKNHPGSKVMMPHKHFWNYILDIDQIKWYSLNNNNQQSNSFSLLRKSIDIIDLDYTSIIDPIKFTEISMMWDDYLSTGGVMLVTLPYNSRGSDKIPKHINLLKRDLSADQYEKMVTDFDIKNLKLSQKNTRKHYSISTDHGLGGTKNFLAKAENMTNNINKIIEDYTGVEPIYASTYRGAKGTPQSTLMIRLAYVKEEN